MTNPINPIYESVEEAHEAARKAGFTITSTDTCEATGTGGQTYRNRLVEWKQPIGWKWVIVR